MRDNKMTIKTILLVDDDRILQNVMNDVLTSLGYNIILANNGCDAINAYKKHFDVVDIILSDYEMPGIDGIELLSKCKNINSNLKTILLSGRNISIELEQMSVIGKDDFAKAVDYFVQKPFKIEDIIQKIV